MYIYIYTNVKLLNHWSWCSEYPVYMGSSCLKGCWWMISTMNISNMKYHLNHPESWTLITEYILIFSVLFLWRSLWSLLLGGGTTQCILDFTWIMSMIILTKYKDHIVLCHKAIALTSFAEDYESHLKKLLKHEALKFWKSKKKLGIPSLTSSKKHDLRNCVFTVKKHGIKKKTGFNSSHKLSL